MGIRIRQPLFSDITSWVYGLVGWPVYPQGLAKGLALQKGFNVCSMRMHTCIKAHTVGSIHQTASQFTFLDTVLLSLFQLQCPMTSVAHENGLSRCGFSPVIPFH